MDIREEFRTFIESKGYSLKQVSQATTLSKTVLSLWMNGEYRGKNERITALISNYLQREKERVNADDLPFVEISIVKYILLPFSGAMYSSF